MKTRMKRVLCLAVAVMLCFSLVGCKELDYARAHHAVMQEDGTLLLNGEVYVPLPYCEDFNPPMGWAEMVSITEPGVPVLLKDFFGTLYFDISEEGIIRDSHIIGNGEVYYCLEKEAAELTARIETGAQMHGTRYSYSYWDEKTYEWKDKVMPLTEEQMNAVKRVLATVEPILTDDVDGQYTVYLEWCSDDGLFSRTIGDVYYYNGHYAILEWNEDGDVRSYEVPAEYNAIFKGITADAIASEEAFYNSDGWY